MEANRIRLLPFVALLASACGGGDDAPTLNHYGDEITESVDAAEATLLSHHEEVLAETDLDRIHDMEAKHMNAMDMSMARMQDAEDSMALCGDHMMGMAGHMSAAVDNLHAARGAMTDTMEDASAEMERHSRAMKNASDLDTAAAEEHQHQAAMAHVMDSMRMHDEDLDDAMQAMEDDGMSMMCPMNSHMHRQR